MLEIRSQLNRDANRNVKKCNLCKKIKPISEFNTGVYDKAPNKEILSMTRFDDLYTRCKTCQKKVVMYISAKGRAAKKGMEFNLTIKDIIIPEICPVLGIKLTLDNTKICPDSPSLDRIDNSKGYIKGNIIVVSMRANLLKGAATLDDLGKIYFFYKNLQEIKNNAWQNEFFW